MWRPDICVFHGGCDDGFGSAWVARALWGNSVRFVPAGYGQPLAVDVTGRHVLMVDFSFKRPQMEDLDQRVASLVVLDHHKTAQAELAPWAQPIETLPRALADVEANLRASVIDTHTLAYFDMERSGARLAWDFCFPGTPPLSLIQHIEDRDLWRFALPGTREISAALRTYPHDFATWDNLDTRSLLAEGKAILRGHQKNVSEFCRNAYLEEIAGYVVPVVNVPYHYASDVAHELLQRHPGAPFAASWFRRADGLKQFSLRSENTRADVSNVAARYGGGGHRNAAGFSVPA